MKTTTRLEPSLYDNRGVLMISDGIPPWVSVDLDVNLSVKIEDPEVARRLSALFADAGQKLQKALDARKPCHPNACQVYVPCDCSKSDEEEAAGLARHCLNCGLPKSAHKEANDD